MTLDERVSRIEDIQAIRDLISELNWLIDHNDIDGLLDHCVENVIYDVGEFGLYRGKSAARSFLDQTVAWFRFRVHRVSNQVIELAGHHAKSRCYYQAALQWRGRALVGSGAYLDDLVKRDGRWLLAARKVVITYLCPLDEGWAKTRVMKLEEETQ